jgi:hypothetical protein
MNRYRVDALRTSGKTHENVNGRAASIEAYLDLTWGNMGAPPLVRWTSYLGKTQCYQGPLVGKEDYARRFLGLRRKEAGYDFSKLETVIDVIVGVCTKLAAA